MKNVALVVLAVLLLGVLVMMVYFWKMNEMPDLMVHGAKVKKNPCINGGHGNAGPEKPVVCIDRTMLDQATYEPDPNPVTVNRGEHIEFWFKDDHGELDIHFTHDTPVIKEGKKNANYFADAKQDVTPHAHIEKKYVIIDRSTQKYKDPTVIIEP
jgi:hypothetical protein